MLLRCSDATKQTWCNALYKALCSIENKDVEEVEAMLNCYEEAGVLIGRLKEESILNVARDYYEKNLDENTKSFVELLICAYSDNGLLFKYAIRSLENKNKKGMRDTKDVMDEFMTGYKRDGFENDTEPHQDEDFDPADDMTEEIILNRFGKTSELIKELFPWENI